MALRRESTALPMLDDGESSNTKLGALTQSATLSYWGCAEPVIFTMLNQQQIITFALVNPSGAKKWLRGFSHSLVNLRKAVLMP